jgi:hypothetical protein
MYFRFKQGDLAVHLDIDDAELLAQDQFAIIEKLKEMSVYWCQFKKMSLHMNSPSPEDNTGTPVQSPPNPIA